MTPCWPCSIWLLAAIVLLGISGLTGADVTENTNTTNIRSSTTAAVTRGLKDQTTTRGLKDQTTQKTPTTNDSKVWIIAPIILLVGILAVFLVIYWKKIRQSRKGKDTSTRGDYSEMPQSS